MKLRRLLLGIVLIIFFALGGFYFYLIYMANTWQLTKPDDSPYFITNEITTLKQLTIPKGSKITYKSAYFWQKKEQKKPLAEHKIKVISFPKGKTQYWGDIPIKEIELFYNSSMKGYNIRVDAIALEKNPTNWFYEFYGYCGDDIGILVKNTSDWSFNKQNITDVSSCGVNYQRYFKDNKKQQKFLDQLYKSLLEFN